MLLYISKEFRDVNPQFLEYLQSHGIQIHAKSMIAFNATSFSVEPSSSHAYFFGSKRAVAFFLDSYKIPTGARICCIGKATGNALMEAGYQVDFIGEQASDPQEVAKKLGAFLGQQKLVVLRSNKSMRSIPKVFPPEQVEEICVYETVLEPKKLVDKPDFLVFTSPSNVESFLLENSIDPTQKIISWGKTTSKYLIERGFSPQVTLQDSNEQEICDFLHTWM
jgi:uroporphyrinogen-III synthase